MSQVDALKEAGWSVRVIGASAYVKEPNASISAPEIPVVLNKDGSLHLTPAKSSLHRRIGAALGLPPVTLPGGMV